MKKTSLDHWIKKKIGMGSADEFDTECLKSYQYKKLQETLHYCKNHSKFYKKLLENISPGEITTLEEIPALPFTTAEDIRQYGNHFICVPQDEIHRITTLQTSGTTSQPKRIFFTKEDLDLTVDFFHNGMTSLVGPGDKVLILIPGQRPGSIGDLLKTGLQRLGVESYIYGPIEDLDHVICVMEQEKISAIVGLPQQVYELSVHYKLYFKETRILLKSILLSADYVPNALINELMLTWNCPVFEHYGMTEMGFGGGVACEAFEGYHLREGDLYIEIVDPVTKAPVADGEYGEVVFTTLTRKAMPLIRYLTGDISRIIRGSCPCGSTLRRLDKVLHRNVESIQLQEGKILTINQLDELLFSIRGIIDYEASIEKREKMDCLVLHVESISPFKQELNQEIHHRLYFSIALGAIIQKHQLIVKINNRSISTDYSSGMKKRRINDLRD